MAKAKTPENRAWLKALDSELSVSGDVKKRDECQAELDALIESGKRDMATYKQAQPLIAEIAQLNRKIGIKTPRAKRQTQL